MVLEQCIIRIALAIVLGYIIGFERKIRYNDAGPRTHAMVSMGACVFLIVSTYGFPNSTYDTSRVASSIVTGISFLGAGNIVYNRGSLHGLTTAAGIWVTAGIGMCAGAGKIKLAFAATGLMIIFQILSHIPIPFLSNRNRYVLKIVYKTNKDDDFKLEDILKFDRALSYKYKFEEDEITCCVTVLINSYKESMEDIFKKVNSNKKIISMEFLDKK